MKILLQEYDPCERAVIEPNMVAPPIDGFPEIAITCFSLGLLNKILENRSKECLCTLDTEDGGVPVYRIDYKGQSIALYMSRVGAPACAVQLEEIISRGVKKIVMFGSCGVLDSSLGKWHTIIPTSAFRDEGLSYHYLPAADEIDMQPASVAALRETFEKCGEPYVCGKVWTTDAIYRETKEKTKRRQAQGCIAVDMECSAVQAVASFRNIQLAQFFYAEDNLADEVWDDRGLSIGIQTEAERLFLAALECGLAL